jgi:putative iron-only hydrogenase system regulator
MEKRIGVIAILVTNRDSVAAMNEILHKHAPMILGRMGLPLRERGLHVISLIIEGTTDEVGALTGKIGRLPGVTVKSVFSKGSEAKAT